jgi:DhnA family fructose-bisphosphate aldolase class Ia
MSKRIFWDDHRAVIVPIDHGLGGIIKGWEEPGKTLEQIVAGQPDAVMTTFGNLKRYRSLLEGKVATLLRLDSGTSALVAEGEKAPNRWRLLYSVEDAVRLGAAGVRLTAWFGTPHEMDCIAAIAKVAGDCQKHGLSLCVETYPVPGPKVRHEDVLNPKHVATVCRLAYEYGADFIKTHFTGSAESFRQVIATCPVPVLIAGGARVENDWEWLSTVKEMLDGGGSGVWCGRNVFQHRDPAAMVRALAQVIHYSATVDEALNELSGVVADAFLPT